MSANHFLMELEQEAAATRRLLERVPEDKMAWTPHAKSFTLGQLALHIAQIPGSVSSMAIPDEFPLPSEFKQAEAASREELLGAFESAMAKCRENLATFDEAQLASEWKVVAGDKTVLAFPRGAMLRTILLNHYYHHRGQLTVYLRMLDVPLPSVYGPSADENPFA